jgi:hypothetical protein
MNKFTEITIFLIRAGVKAPFTLAICKKLASDSLIRTSVVMILDYLVCVTSAFVFHPYLLMHFIIS